VHRRLLRASVPLLTGLSVLAGAGSARAASDSLTYYGGPVAHSMNAVLVSWGPDVRSAYTDPTSGDPGLLRYLASASGSPSDIGGVLAQYMDATGSNSANRFSYTGALQINPSVAATPPGTVQDSDIQSELAGDIGSGTLPAPAGDGMSTIYVVLFPPGDDVCQGGTCANSGSGFCAYHSSFQVPGSSTQVLYAAIVDDGPGTPNYGYCGPSTDDVANQTDVVSHELAETINDPLVAESSGYGPPLGWYNESLGEIADICVGSDEQALNGIWTVQKIWSNLDGACVASEPAYSAPTASFLAPSTAVAAQPVSFDAASSSDPAQNTTSASFDGTSYSIPSGITSYQWSWGDGSPTAAGPSPTAAHTFASPGNYQISLTVTDGLGFTSTVTQEVSVAAPAPAPPAPAPLLALPGAATGHASHLTSSAATVTGTIAPHGLPTTYQVQFGTTTSYGHSSPSLQAGSGSASKTVSVTLTGLRPGTTYHYRMVAMSKGGTAVGADRTFTTDRAGPLPPRLSLSVLRRRRPRAVLRNGLAVHLRCSRACVVHLEVMALPASAGGRRGWVAVTVARKSVRSRTGRTSVTIRFSARARARLARVRGLQLLLSGYATGLGGDSESRSVQLRIKLS
jgi:hypothetical protein